MLPPFPHKAAEAPGVGHVLTACTMQARRARRCRTRLCGAARGGAPPHLISISSASTVCQTPFGPARRGCAWSGPSSGGAPAIPPQSCCRCHPAGRGRTCARAAVSPSDQAPWPRPPAWAAKDPGGWLIQGSSFRRSWGCYLGPTLSPASRELDGTFTSLLPAGDPWRCGSWSPGYRQQPAGTAFPSFGILLIFPGLQIICLRV